MRIKTSLLLVLVAATAWASGQIGVTGYPASPRTLKGGTGINISSDGTFTATGEAVATGAIPFGNISTALRGKYLGFAATATNATAYKGNSAPSATEFSYLQGVSSAIQTQINAKANTSSLAAVATAGTYSALTGKPTLSTVAGTGAYADLTGKPTLATVATTGAYTDLTGKPALATVATSGSYADLSNKPTIPAAQVNSDWNASTGAAQVLNKPSLAAVATTGSYTDLSNKPAQYTLPTASTSVLGGVKVDGTSVVIDGAGRISSTVSAGVSSFNGRSGAVSSAPDDYAVADITGLQNDLDSKAGLSSPTFTGTVSVSNDDGSNGIQCYNTGAMTTTSFTTAEAGTFCWNAALGKEQVWNGTTLVDLGGTGGTWGSITGTLSTQTDLWAQMQLYMLTSAHNTYAAAVQVKFANMSSTISALRIAVVAGGGTYTPPTSSSVTLYANADSDTTGAVQKGSGTITIGAAVNSVAGQVGNAWQFASTTANASIPISGNLDQSLGTMGFWLNVTNFGSSSVGVVGTDSTAGALALYYSPGYGAYRFAYGDSVINITEAVLSTGGAHYVELAWNKSAGTASVRIDGANWTTYAMTGVGGAAPNGTVLLVGPDGTNDHTFTIDQLMVASTYQYNLYALRNATTGI